MNRMLAGFVLPLFVFLNVPLAFSAPVGNWISLSTGTQISTPQSSGIYHLILPSAANQTLNVSVPKELLTDPKTALASPGFHRTHSGVYVTPLGIPPVVSQVTTMPTPVMITPF